LATAGRATIVPRIAVTITLFATDPGARTAMRALSESGHRVPVLCRY
jgi:hypothetical protein